MNRFRAIGTQLFYSFPIQVEELCKLDAYLDLIESSGDLRKFMRFALTKQLPNFWQAPPNLVHGVFKKPSAKRLANRVNKKRKLQPNEVAKDSYRYKIQGGVNQV